MSPERRLQVVVIVLFVVIGIAAMLRPRIRIQRVERERHCASPFNPDCYR